MSERAKVLSSKLPHAVLTLIDAYDSHLTADLIRSLQFRDIEETPTQTPRKVVTAVHPTYFCPIVWQTMFRKRRNAIRNQSGHIFMPILPLFGDAHSWVLSFDAWRFNNLLDLEYLPDWAIEEYLCSTDD